MLQLRIHVLVFGADIDGTVLPVGIGIQADEIPLFLILRAVLLKRQGKPSLVPDKFLAVFCRKAAAPASLVKTDAAVFQTGVVIP